MITSHASGKKSIEAECSTQADIHMLLIKWSAKTAVPLYNYLSKKNPIPFFIIAQSNC